MAGKARTLKWFTTLRTLVAIADNEQETFDLLADMSVADMEGSTVTRMILEMWVENDVTSNPKTMDMGILWVNNDAFQVEAFPDADDEDERADWIWRGRMHSVTNNVGLSANAGGYMYRDLRAKRICRSEMDHLTLICDMDGNGTGGMFLTFMTRVLMQMP